MQPAGEPLCRSEAAAALEQNWIETAVVTAAVRS
jgi:hypothetical protein